MDIDLGHLLHFHSSRYTRSINTWEAPTNLRKHVWETAIRINTIHGLQNKHMIYETTTITKQPTVNSLNFVVDSLLHALQAFRCMSKELAVWEAGVVMGRDTWNRNTRLMDFTCGLLICAKCNI